MNTPLCINRARLFHSRTPPSHLSQMDLIQIGSVGLISGIDKYAPDGEVVTKQFRSTAMGRMGGNFIEEYSAPMLHFFPVDKRKLYRANKIVGKSVGPVDFGRVAEGVNEKGDVSTTPDEMADLMAAASTVSSDSSLPSDPDAPEPITRFAAPESVRPDVQFERGEAMGRMEAAIARLTVFEQKLLRLRGVAHFQNG
jgi:RNA polymerase sigma factor (sigma-70 family)